MTAHDPTSLRRALAPLGSPFGDDGAGRAAIAAAVLLPLVTRDDGVAIILTERALHLRDHGGQISFPGGRIDPDDKNEEAAALREAHEEIGLEPDRVEVLARLPVYHTVTGYEVTPVVGWIATPPAAYALDPGEVAAVFELPLAVALDKKRYQRGAYRRGSALRRYWVLHYEGRRIWGATAAILAHFADRLHHAGSAP